MKKLSQTKWLDSEQKVLSARTDGKNLVELTAYQNIALWWFIRFRLYHSEETNRLAQILMKNGFLFSFVDFLYDLLTSTLCKLVSMFFKARVDKKGPKVLMVAHNLQWKRELNPTGVSRKCDVFLDPIMKELKKRDYTSVTISSLKYSVSAVKIMIERLKAEDVIHRESNAYWSPKIWSRQFYANKYFRNLWKNLSKKDARFVALLQKGRLAKEMPYYFNSFFGHIVKQIEMAKEAVKEEKPDLILVTSEGSGIFEKALLVAGKLKKIPTLAVQHGHIGPLHQGYMHFKNSIASSGSIQSPYLQIADKTVVYGPFHYNFLTKISAYPSSAVAVTGQPRYDRLLMANRIFSREEFCAKLGLDPHRKIVLVATQKVPIRKAFIESVLKGLRPFSDVQTIVKPHPKENIELYEKLIEEEKMRVVLLPKESETLEALYACDLLVAMSSTVITEATILRKPSVTVRSIDEDPAPFYDEVTLRIDLGEDLAPIFRKALYDEKTREKLKKAERKFAFNHTYKQDGKATERVVDLIEQLIKKKTK
ncbi:MAG: UDP-N-acetylglucosamine 2-epimerase [Candidatus Bathyarchaeota archaeon]|nr:UDP-N-acetylglucosamine 2-epimerase [Candidatus Bathyarchaeota archaeon]